MTRSTIEMSRYPSLITTRLGLNVGPMLGTVLFEFYQPAVALPLAVTPALHRDGPAKPRCAANGGSTYAVV